jgi:hypothetical protein
VSDGVIGELARAPLHAADDRRERLEQGSVVRLIAISVELHKLNGCGECLSILARERREALFAEVRLEPREDGLTGRF